MPGLPEAMRAEFYRQAVEASPVGVLLVDAGGLIKLANGCLSDMFGYGEDELLGLPVESLVPPDTASPHERKRAAYLTSPDQLRRMGHGRDLTGIRKDGSLFPVEIGLNPVTVGHDLFVLAVITDITERKKSEQAVRDRETRLRAFMANANDGVAVLSVEGVLLEANPRMGAIVGRDVPHIIGRSIREFLPPGGADAAVQKFEATVASGGGQILGVEVIQSEGTIAVVDFSLTRVAIAGEPLVFAIGREVTRERLLERQLLQAQRLESIGRVAGGVAHDFNNILTVISGNAELIAARLPAADPNREDLGEVINATRRAGALTRQLLAFSRQQVLEPKVFDLGELLVGMEKMLRRVIGEDVELEVCLFPGGGSVRADPGQIEQVVMNLVVNARDSFAGAAGAITIETSRVTIDEEYASRHAGASVGECIMLSVSDTGSGMTPEIQGRIFEPFFTTKEPGRGTGLGLSTAYGIVAQSGGHIWVYSEVGKGTTFKVYLPRVRSQDAEPRVGGDAAAEGGHETILFVEDDDSVRRLAVGILTEKGYLVLAAENGRRALDMIEGNVARIDLLVTDVVMPEMSGPVLGEHLRARWPGLKVLYVSGYTDSTISRHGLAEGEAFLQKPFSVEALARRVRSILDPAPSRT